MSPKVFPKLCLDTDLDCGANVSKGEAAASLAAVGTLGLGAEQKAKPCSTGSTFCWEGVPSRLTLSVAKVEPPERPGDCLVLCDSPDRPKIDFYFQTIYK